MQSAGFQLGDLGSEPIADDQFGDRVLWSCLKRSRHGVGVHSFEANETAHVLLTAPNVRRFNAFVALA